MLYTQLDIYNWETILAIILFNIIAYSIMMLAIFCGIYLITPNSFQIFSDFKKLNIMTFISSAFILTLLALAGTPPFIGFITKFLSILLLFKNLHFLKLFMYIFINIFSIYFYIIILRFTINQPLEHSFYKKFYFYKINSSSIFYLITLLSFICLNLVMYQEFLNFLILVFSN